jgi:c-di-GMP-binding flagellar brake protein YcgR
MTKKQTQKSTNKKNELANSIRNRRKEFRLDLPLAAKVEGKSATGKPFVEKTTIVNISSLGAYFSLNALLTIGARLFINMELPSQLTEGKKLKLKLRGQVVRLELSTVKNKKQGVALNFDEEFKSDDIRFIAED